MATLSKQEIDAQLKKAGMATTETCEVTFDEINSFGDRESLLEMYRNIAGYNKMLGERIVLINKSLTAAVPFTRENLYLFCAYTGSGKCFSKGTNILMFDGSVKKVEEIKVGDKVMGPDSKSRNVLTLASGKEHMYDIVPIKGEKYTVNASHILSLRMTSDRKIFKDISKGSVVNIPVKDYISQSVSFKHHFKGYRTGVNFKEQSIDIDPYILGYWLGDGSSEGSAFCTADPEVVTELYKYTDKVNKTAVHKHHIREQSSLGNGKAKTYFITTGSKSGQSGRNIVKKMLQKHNLLNNKHIPSLYKINSREIRLQLLAGLVDSDGNSANSLGLDFCFKSEKLALDVVYLCRSLGFAAYTHKVKKMCTNSKVKKVGIYNRISVSGDLSLIPTKIERKKFSKRRQIKDVLNVGIEVVPVGVGEYYGFSVDKDHLFLLADFTVVHNSTVAANISYPLWKQGKKVLVISNEETKQDVLLRIACLDKGYNFNDYKKGSMPQDILREVCAMMPEIAQYVKVLDVTWREGMTTKIEGVKGALNALKDQGFSCVLIDYYQLIKYSIAQTDRTTYDVLNDFRVWLGQYIKSSDIPVCLFVQLYSQSKRPSKGTDLDTRVKDCSAIVEPATVIIEVIPNFEDATTDFVIIKDRFGVAGNKIVCPFEKGRYLAQISDKEMAERALDRLQNSMKQDK